MNISAIIIAKNEENLIADCIDSIGFCDEIMLIDNNSSDRTADLAKKLGAKVVKANTSDFSDLRNIGLKHSSGKWVLYIDSDERVSEELKKSIIEVVKSEDKYVAFKVMRKNFYLGNTEWPKIEKMERLFLREKLMSWKGKLHETPVFEGEAGELDGFLLHYTHRNLTQMLEKTIVWSDTEARLRFDANHPKMTWWRFPRVMLTGFFDSYIKQKGYKAGTAGLIESVYQAYSSFITYAKLWELQNPKNKRST
jgi:glycosyltransferase involved in cell wall biosynthesis